MAGLIVHATDGSNGQDLNVRYTLESAEYPYPKSEIVNGQSVDLNARIFPYDNVVSGRTEQRTTTTGEILSGGPGGFTVCKGWSVFGPGAVVPGYGMEVGNGFVLDCGDTGASPPAPSHFWISNVSTPTGAAGAYGGHWEVNVVGSSAGSGNLTTNPMSFNNYFTVSNGDTEQVNLVWHPNPPPQPKTTANCTGAYVSTPQGYLKYVTISGTDNDKTNYEIDPGNDHTFGYDALSATISVRIIRYKNTGTAARPIWTLDNDATSNYDCYHATCNIADQPIDVKGNGPNNSAGDPVVIAGQPFTVYVPIKNDNPSADAETIPAPGVPPGYHLSLTESADDYQGGLVENDVGNYLNVGGSTVVPITFTANSNTNSVRNLTLNFYPDLWPHGSLGDSCSVTFPIYQHFSSSLGAKTDLKPTEENPYQGADYSTTVSVSETSHSVNIPTNSLFYKKPAVGAQQNIASNTGGTYTAPSQVAFSGHYDIPPGSFGGGDEYCASIHADYTSGYVGPDNSVVDGTGPADAVSCPRVANEPYFKVYNAGISAGGDFDQCTTNGGTLAGFNDISDPSGASRGSSSQLSALALIKITGVASAQSPGNITRSPTDLTFANTGVQVDPTGNESPVLGGNFGGCQTLTNETAPSTAANYSGPMFVVNPAKKGAYTHTGNITIKENPPALGANQNVSLFVDGNVYISSDITYDQSTGWTAGTAPSFVLHATGNIYIDPSVKTLSGLYIAQKTNSSATNGKIYTCADSSGFAPMSASGIYGCKNQLVVYGSFVANQVNLMRSFGSLRDEIPNPGTPDILPTPGASVPLDWSHAGSIAGETCTQIDNPREKNEYTWNDNYLCVPPADSSVQIGWTNKGKTDDLKKAGLTNCTDSWKNVLKPTGYKNYDKWDQAFLCSNVPISFRTSADPAQSCTLIDEPSNTGWPTVYVCVQKGSSGSTGTAPTPKSPPYHCSNNAGTATTCAGEVFEFSPQLYLANPSNNPPSNGALQFQSITSLPPVL